MSKKGRVWDKYKPEANAPTAETSTIIHTVPGNMPQEIEKPLIAYAHTFTSDPEVVKDLFQEAYVQIWTQVAKGGTYDATMYAKYVRMGKGEIRRKYEREIGDQLQEKKEKAAYLAEKISELKASLPAKPKSVPKPYG